MKLLERLFARSNRTAGDNKFLFILSPPYCGSTLLSRILDSSREVSVNNSEGTREGQTLPEVCDMMFGENRWNEDLVIDWTFVKEVWYRHWDTRKNVLLEKSPPNLIRAEKIETNFDPAYFIVLWRNPYAHCESQMRRNGNSPRQAAGFAVRCLKKQKENIERLKNVLPVSYEELTNDPDKFTSRAEIFINELHGLDTTGRFNVHNLHGQNLQIENLNKDKIALLNDESIDQINSVLELHQELISYFGYELIRLNA